MSRGDVFTTRHDKMWLQQLAGGHSSNADLSLDIAIDHTQWCTAWCHCLVMPTPTPRIQTVLHGQPSFSSCNQSIN